MTSRRFVVAAAASLALMMAAPVGAQTVTERGYVVGFGGASMSTVNAGLFGGGVGVSIYRDLQLFGEFGRMQDVLPGFTQDDLNAMKQEALNDGSIFVGSAKTPTVYASGGLKYLVPTGTGVRPYALIGGGVAHMMPGPKFVIDGLDITSTALQDAEIANVFRTENRPLATAGAGVAINLVRHVKVDVGYKYSRIFVNTDYLQSPDSPHQHKNVDVHRVSFGIGYSF